MVEQRNRLNLDSFMIESVKNGSLFGSRIVRVKGLKKKEYSFKELYQFLKSQKSKQEETPLKNALSKVLISDATSKKGTIESLLDRSISEVVAIVGKEQCDFIKEIAECIRKYFIKGQYVLKDLGSHFIKAIIFNNSNQFLGFTQALPSEVLSYDQYTEVKKEWLRMCNSIYEQIQSSKTLKEDVKSEICKSLKITCTLIMMVFNQAQTRKPEYAPFKKMLSENFFIFLNR